MNYVMKHPKIVLMTIFALSSIPVCFIGFTSDEIRFNVIAYQIATGDKFLKEIWFLLYFAELLVAPFIWIYLKLVGGTTGLILFLKILGCICTFLVSIPLYKTINKISNESVAFFSTMTFLLLSPVNMVYPHYKNIPIWCGMLVAICFINYVQDSKIKLLVFAGFFSVIGITAYPTMVILAPFYIFVSIHVTCKMTINKSHRFIYIMSFFATGALLSIAVLFTTDIGNLNNIAQVFASDVHDTAFLQPIFDIVKACFAGVLFGILPLVIAEYLGNRFILNRNRILFYIGNLLKNKPIVFLIYYIIFSTSLFLKLVFSPNSCIALYSVGMLYFASMVLYKRSKLKHKKSLFLFLSIPPAISSLSIFFASEMALPHPWLVPLIQALPLFFMMIHEDWANSKSEIVITRLLCCSICFLLFFTRIAFSINSDYSKHNKFIDFKMLNYGPAKYIMANTKDYQNYHAEQILINKYCESGDSLYIVQPAVSVGYLMSDIKVSECTWNILSNSPRLEDFFNTNPDRIPKLVIMSTDEQFSELPLNEDSYFLSMLKRDYDYYLYNDDIAYFVRR